MCRATRTVGVGVGVGVGKNTRYEVLDTGMWCEQSECRSHPHRSLTQ